MIRRTRSFEQLERRYTREVVAGRTYLEALAVFEALWPRPFDGRPRDLEDAAGVVRRKGPDLRPLAA